MKSRLTKLCSLFLTFAVTATTVFSSDLALVSAYADDDVAIVEEVAVEEAVVEEEVAADAVVVEDLADGEIVEALDAELPVSANEIEITVATADKDTNEVSVSWNAISANAYLVEDYIVDPEYFGYYEFCDVEEMKEVYGYTITESSASFYGEDSDEWYTLAMKGDDGDYYYGYFSVDLRNETDPFVNPEDVPANTKEKDNGVTVSFGADCPEKAYPGFYYYTGKKISPALMISDGDRALVAKKDYTVKYFNNKDVHTANVKDGTGNRELVADDAKAPYAEITFKGDYASIGTIKKYFSIVPVELGGSSSDGVWAWFMGIKTTLKKSNKAQAPTGVINIYRKGAITATLKAQKGDYEVRYVSANSVNDDPAKFDDMEKEIPANAVGNYRIYVKAEGKVITSEPKYFNIAVIDPAKDLTKVTITASMNKVSVDQIAPSFDVMDRVNTIVIGKGRAAQTISGDAIAANIESITVDEASQKIGKKAKLDVIVKDENSLNLVPGLYTVASDLQIIGGKNFAAAEVTVNDGKVTTKTDRKGNIKSFSAEVNYSVSNNGLVDVVNQIVIKDNGATLVEGQDYSLTYKVKSVIGRTTVTVKGLNKYLGAKTTIAINLKAELAKGMVEVSAENNVGLVNTSDAKKINSVSSICLRKKFKDVVYDVTLFPGTDSEYECGSKDYAVKYNYKAADNKVTATITFKGAYKSLKNLEVVFDVNDEIHSDDVNWTGEDDTIFVKGNKNGMPVSTLIKKAKIAVKDLSGTALKLNKDYVVSMNAVYDPMTCEKLTLSNNKVSANQLVLVKITGKGQYQFGDVYARVQLGDAMISAGLISSDKGIVSTNKIYQRGDTSYTDDMLPSIELKDGSKLVKGDDYYLDLDATVPKKSGFDDYYGTTGIKNVKVVMQPNGKYSGSVVVKVKVVRAESVKNDGNKKVLSK